MTPYLTSYNDGLEFNTPEGAEARRLTMPLTLEEEVEVVSQIDNLNGQYRYTYATKSYEERKELIQRFLNHYQNLVHFADANGFVPIEPVDNRNCFGMLSFAKRLADHQSTEQKEEN